MVDGLDFAVGADGAGVEEIALEMRDPDETGDTARRRGDEPEAVGGGPQEAGPQEEVLRRIAGHRQLGKEHEVCAGRLRLLEAGENPLAVAVEIADRRVDLRERETHGPRIATQRRKVVGRQPRSTVRARSTSVSSL